LHNVVLQCITAQLPSEDGAYKGGKVVYIDTEGAFRPERLEPICDRFNVEYRDALDNVIYARVHNSDQLVRAGNFLSFWGREKIRGSR
jgi:RecA/RadA recombinase